MGALAKAIAASGLATRDVARKAGVDHRALLSWLTGESEPTEAELRAIGEALKRSWWDLAKPKQGSLLP
jgi:transcriptional regulator with XRE-family HTH domain